MATTNVVPDLTLAFCPAAQDQSDQITQHVYTRVSLCYASTAATPYGIALGPYDLILCLSAGKVGIHRMPVLKMRNQVFHGFSTRAGVYTTVSTKTAIQRSSAFVHRLAHKQVSIRFL